jgi:hypothetical protein
MGEILLETTIITDLMYPSVNQVWLFVLLLFTREKNCSHTFTLPNIAIILNPKDLRRGNFSFGK